MEIDRPILTLLDGITHYTLRQYDKAQDSFAQMSKLQSGVPFFNERIRLEFLNNQALTEVKRKDRDMELCIAYWKTGMRGLLTCS